MSQVVVSLESRAISCLASHTLFTATVAGSVDRCADHVCCTAVPMRASHAPTQDLPPLHVRAQLRPGPENKPSAPSWHSNERQRQRRHRVRIVRFHGQCLARVDPWPSGHGRYQQLQVAAPHRRRRGCSATDAGTLASRSATRGQSLCCCSSPCPIRSKRGWQRPTWAQVVRRRTASGQVASAGAP